MEELVFNMSKRFSEDISDHIVRTYVDDADSLRFHILSDEVITNIDVLETSIMSWVDGKEDASLVVRHKGRGTGCAITDLLL